MAIVNGEWHHNVVTKATLTVCLGLVQSEFLWEIAAEGSQKRETFSQRKFSGRPMENGQMLEGDCSPAGYS